MPAILIPKPLADLTPRSAQEIAAAKLKSAAQAAISTVKKPAPILGTGRTAPTPKPTLAPGIDFAWLKQQDDAAKAKAGTLKLPPGINFAGLKAMTDAAKKPAAPVDPLQDVYNKFSATMKVQGKDTTALYDRIMKEITDMYGTANKQTDTNYAPTLKALGDMVNNVGGPANANSIAEVPANIAWLKSANASNLAGVKSSIDMLKGSIPDMFASIATGMQGNLQQAMLDRAAAIQAAAAAASGGGGGGGGGGGRGRGGGGGGGSGSGKTKYTDTASETYDQYNLGDVEALQSLDPVERALALNAYNLSNRNVNSTIKYSQAAANQHNAKILHGVPNLFGGSGSKNLAKARATPAHRTQAARWQDIINAFSGISGSLGGAKGKRNVKSGSSYKI